MEPYPLALFQLNAAFARKVAALTGQPFAAVLLHYTHAYRRFRIGAALDESHPVWQAYLAGLAAAPDPAEYTYRFYLERERMMGPLKVERLFGCFSYDPQADGRIRLHFANLDDSGRGPLSRAQMPARLAELAAMFAEIRARVPGTATVIGGSWLYNLDAYRRLFPPGFVAQPQPVYDEFPYITLWGQFIDSERRVKRDLADTWLARLDACATLDEAARSFPYPVLHVKAPVGLFFEHFGMN